MRHILKICSIPTFLQQAVLLSLVAVSSVSFAIPSDRNQPIELQADRATFNDKTGVTTYTGNVVIVQGTMKLQADSVVAQLSDKLSEKRELKTVTAVGHPAKFQQIIDPKKGLAYGEGQKAIYNAETGIITLIGNAYLIQDGSTVRGDTLRYSMNAGDIEAVGSKSRRVQLVLPPSTSKSFPGARQK